MDNLGVLHEVSEPISELREKGNEEEEKERKGVNKNEGVEHASIKSIKGNGCRVGHLLSKTVSNASNNASRNSGFYMAENACPVSKYDGNVSYGTSQMKSQILDLMADIEGLKVRMEKLSSEKLSAGNLHSDGERFDPRFPSVLTAGHPHKNRDVEAVVNHVAYIKTKFQALKRNGSKLYCTLDEQEKELLKDIAALKSVLSLYSVCSVTTNAAFPKSRISVINDTKNYTRELSFNCGEEKSDVYAEDVVNKCGLGLADDDRLPLSVPPFRHKWDEKDHLLFLRVYRKFKTEDSRLDELCRMFPFKAKEEISSHIAKYDGYLQQKASIKNHLALWKKKKLVEKKALEERMAEQKLEENKQKLIEKEKIKKLKKDRESKKEDVLKWKESLKKNTDSVKSDTKIFETLEPSASRISAKQSHAYTEKEREEIAVRLKEYRDRRRKDIEEENEQKTAEQLQRKRIYNVSSRAHFLERNNEFMKQIKDRQAMESKLKAEKDARLQKLKSTVEIKAKRDQERLLQATQSHLAYKHSQDNCDASATPLTVDSIPHLATPMWRQGL